MFMYLRNNSLLPSEVMKNVRIVYQNYQNEEILLFDFDTVNDNMQFVLVFNQRNDNTNNYLEYTLEISALTQNSLPAYQQALSAFQAGKISSNTQNAMMFYLSSIFAS